MADSWPAPVPLLKYERIAGYNLATFESIAGREAMADASNDASDILPGIIGLIVIVALGYWFFAEDDIDDVAQSAIEAA